MWDFFIRNDRFAYLFLIALLAVGTYSLITIPKESSPEVVIPVGVVTTVYPGTPAADMESLITNELERGLTSVENVKKITSTSREGVSSVVVEFEANADLESSITDLKDTVDTIKSSLPNDAEDPSVSEVDYVDRPVLTLALSADLSDAEFTRLAKDLENEIESVSGVSRVETQGVRDREVTILVDPTALVQYNLSLPEISNALRNANLTFPIGQIVIDKVSYNIAYEGDIVSSDAVLDVAIANRNGQPIFVHDIAIVEDGLAPASFISRLSIDGQPSVNSITVDVYKRSGGDITKITAAVKERVEALKAPGGLLFGIQTVAVLDAGDQIASDLFRLSTSGLQTVVLVVLLLMVAIGWREGLLAGAAIPLSFLFGFIGLYFSGNTINFLSLFSLILGIGILVDSAIVMVEGVNRKMKADLTIDKKQAAIDTTHEFAAPLISGTLTTVSMFVGLFIVSGVIGQFIASIPFTLIFLLFASLFVALAIVPLLAAGFLHRHTHSKLEERQVEYARKLEAWYRKKLTPIIFNEDKQQRFLAILLAALIFAVSLTINVWAGAVAALLTYAFARFLDRLQQKRKFGRGKRALIWYPGFIAILAVAFIGTSVLMPSLRLVKVAFFEQSDVDYIIVEVEYPEGTTKETTDIGARRIEELLYDEPDIDSFTITVGSGSQFGSGGTGEKFASFFINLSADRTRTSTEVVEHLRSESAQLSDLKVTVSEPSDGPPTGAAIIVKYLGEDLDKLTELANDSAKILRATEGAVNVETSTNNNSTELVFDLDRERAASLGVDPFTVSQIARTAVFGTEATSLTTLDEDINVVIRLNVNNDQNATPETADEMTVEALRNISIPTAQGPVALGELVSISLRESRSIITHEDGDRVVSLTADVSSDANARDVQAEALKSIQEQLDIPDSVTLSTGGGETDESNKAFLEMFAALVVGVLLMVGVLVLQFNSFLHTKYVLSILPYSLIGIMFGLAITFNPLSFPSIMGFIALSGIVVNNSILLIDMMNNARRQNLDKEIHEVVLDAAASRIRPILLTTITTVIGMIPLTYAGDLWSPLAYAVMFGLVFSVIITLVLIPILYVRKPGELH
jgi:multidrug efflux pump subunit AcrB